jgi:SNF2 family DNA or RNA helicase
MDKTKSTLADADFFSIMNVLMQLRKVCNHPDLFESRTIESPFIMTDKLVYNCPSLIQKNLICFENERNPLDRIQLKDLYLSLLVHETDSRIQHDEALSLFPNRTLNEAFVEHFNQIPSSASFSTSLQQQRLAMEGQAMGKLHFTNCNLLHSSNTQHLKQTIPKILPETRPSSSTKSDVSRFQHQHPSYLNVACLPFA